MASSGRSALPSPGVWERGGLRSYLRGAILACAAAVCLLALSCGNDSPDKPRPIEGVPYGSLPTPRVSSEVDPLLVDAYQAMGVDGFSVANVPVSWAAIAVGTNQRDWRTLDLNIEQALRRGMSLSLIIEFVHGGQGEAPSWRWPIFPGWEDVDLFHELVRFLREIEARSGAPIRFVWLGEGIDRYAASHPGDETAILAFFDALSDSARAIFPAADIGTIITPSMMGETGGESLVRSVRLHMDILGLSIYPDLDGGTVPAPQVFLESLRDEATRWSDLPVAIIEAGYPSDEAVGATIQAQAEFARGIAAWLRTEPENLQLFCWSPVHDASAQLADTLASRRYVDDPASRAAYADLLRFAALRRLDGTPKAARQVWIEEKP